MTDFTIFMPSGFIQPGRKYENTFKDAVKSVLRIGSAHNKGGPADINIAQISHFFNSSVIKLWFIFIYERSKPEKIDIQL